MNRSASMPKAIYLPAGLALLIFLVAPLLSHFRVLPPFEAFLVWIGSIVPGVIALLVGAFAATKGARLAGLLSLVIGLVPIAVIGSGAVKGRNYPPINDISTNLDNPPKFVDAAQAAENQGKDMTYPDGFKPPVLAFYPDLISLQLPMPAPQAFELARSVAGTLPNWHLSRVDPESLTFEGSETAGIFQFTDDFVVRVMPLEGTSQIDMRSRSRVGQADFGVNANRIRSYFAALGAQAGAGQ